VGTTNVTWLLRFSALAAVLFTSAHFSQAQWKAPDTKNIPPEVIKQMDPEIVSGKRPTFATVTQEGIFALRETPRLDADFVRFSFDLAKLTSVQRDIVRNWIRSGHNTIYLESNDLRSYAILFDVEWADALRKDEKLLDHPVNTDCKDFALSYYNSDRKASSAYRLRKLPAGLTVIVEHEKEPVAGMFPIGEGRVFFRGGAYSGTDSDRWVLNYWHWALGLAVPGAADRFGTSGSATTLTEASKRDRITLKNGDTVTGDIQNDHFSIQTSYGTLKFSRAEIDRITLEGAGANVDILRLKNGDKLSGVVQDRSLIVALSAGGTAELEKDKVKEINFRASQ
jgi:hypothetical protein